MGWDEMRWDRMTGAPPGRDETRLVGWLIGRKAKHGERDGRMLGDLEACSGFVEEGDTRDEMQMNCLLSHCK
jgi:hypothetical protein